MRGPRKCAQCPAIFDPNGHTGAEYELCLRCRKIARAQGQPARSVVVEKIVKEVEPAVVRELRATLARRERAFDAEKERTQALVEAVYSAARDSVAALQIAPVPPPPKSSGTKTAETAISPLADWQLGKKTPSYNTDICERRIEEYGDRVIKLTAIQRADHPVKDLHVHLLGDLVEGELIFPGQHHRIDSSLFRQVITNGPRILGNFLRKMAANFEKVHVVGVIGNHGRLGGRESGDYHPETNADAMMYEVTRQIVASEKRITFAPTIVEGERLWHAVDRIGEKGFLLFHGDQVKGGALGYPWYGFGKKILGWANGGIPEKFDYALSGHFHTPVRGLYGKIRHWGSGSTESDNTYAQEFFAASGTPSQWLLFAHPRHGVTAEYEVHLT